MIVKLSLELILCGMFYEHFPFLKCILSNLSVQFANWFIIETWRIKIFQLC